MPRRRKGKTEKRWELDLHGYKVRDAEETLLQFLSDSIVAGERRVHVIHGHGTGKIKEMVHRVLSESDVVRSFELQMMNTGTTVVYL